MPVKKPVSPIVADAMEYLAVKDQEEQLKEKREQLRLKLLAQIEELGREDSDGHILYPLDVPIRFRDRHDKVHVIDQLKNQLSLRPAIPVPDPEKAEKLLRKKGLWLTPEQEQALEEIKAQLPLFDISFDIDLDAFGDLVFRKKISAKEYERTLQEQKEIFSLIPVEIS